MASDEVHAAYPLRAVARLTGLSADVIRAWERRYGVVSPVRGPRGARLYSSGEVRRLRLLARSVVTGRSIGDLAALSEEELAALVNGDGDVASTPSADEPDDIIEHVLSAVNRLDTSTLERYLGEALVALGSAEFVRRVVGPLLVQAGELWRTGELSVAEEHFVSGAERNVLSDLLRTRRIATGPTLPLATPSGERHEFGLLMAALLIADAGFDICYLGVDLPADEIAAAAQRCAAVAIGLGLANADNRANAVAQVAAIECAMPSHCELWLGGREAGVVMGSLEGSCALVVDDLDKMGRELPRLRAACAAALRNE